MDELSQHGLEVVTAPGEAIHIDWVNTTAATPEELIEQASKTYLDWYLLTQVRSSGEVRPAARVELRMPAEHDCSSMLL